MEIAKTEIKKAFDVIWHPHPVTPIAGRKAMLAEINGKQTLRQILLACDVDPYQPIVISVNDKLIPVSQWDTFCPENGSIINVQATVTGGGGDGGSNPLQVVAMIAVVVVSTYLTGGTGAFLGAELFGSVTVGQILGAAVAIGGSLLVGAIFAPSAQNVDFARQAPLEQTSPTYSLSGGSNSIRPYESMPVVMGNHRIFPDLAARPFTEYQDNDQYLYQIFHFGLSDIDLADFTIGTTAITSYQDYEWKDVDSNGKLTDFPGNVDSASGASLTNAAGWIERTTSTDTYRAGIDIVGTFYYANDEGGLDSASATIEIEYRQTGTSTWSTTRTETISEASQSPVRRTYFIDFPSVGTYDVRVRRTTDDSTDTRLQNKTIFDVIRSYQLDDATYVGQKRRGLIIRASEQLNGAIQQLSATAEARANYYNGSAWVSAKTSNPAHWFMDFAKGRYNANNKLVYGVGLSDSQIDLDALVAWADFCDYEGLTFNAVLDTRQTASEILISISKCGFASPTWASGKLGIVWDGRDQTAVAAFGMSNIIRGSFEVSYLTEQLADEIVVSFVNANDDWKADEVRVTVPDVTDPVRSSTVQLFGCTNETMAGKFANYLAAQQYYRTRRITWETDFEGFVCQRGDVVLLSHDLTQWGYSGRIIDILNFEANEVWESFDIDWQAADFEWQGGSIITLDRAVPRTGDLEYMAIRQPDGTLTTYEVLPAAETSDQIILVGSPDIDTNYAYLDHLWFFSPLATPGKKVKIISVQPMSESRIRVTATDEDPQFYAAWDGTWNPATTKTLLLNSNPSASNPQINEFVYRGADGNVISLVTLTFQAKNLERANIKWRINGGVWNKATIYSNTFEFNVETAGDLEVDITPINGALVGENVVATTYIFGQQTSQLPPDVDTIITTYNGALGGQIVLNWTAVNDFRQPNIQYEIRLGTSWESGKVLGRTPLTQFTAQGDGKYWIAAVYVNNGVSLYSATPTSIDVIGATLQKNVIASYDESVSWSGAVTGYAEITSSGVLQLENDGTNVLGTDGTYTVPNSHIIDAGRVTPCNVSITVNGGGVAVGDNILDATNVLTLTDILNAALGTQITIQPQIAIGDAGGTFGSWQNFIPGFYNGRYFKARLLISTSDASINVVVTDFIFAVDVPDRVDTGQVTTNASGSTVTYTSAFIGGASGLSIPNVQLTIVNAQANDDIILTNETLSGFDVQVLNGGVGVVRTVNWLAQGY